MKILIISHYYPPHSSVASLRVYDIAKYLHLNGAEVKVLTSEKYGFDGPQLNPQPNPGFEVIQSSYLNKPAQKTEGAKTVVKNKPKTNMITRVKSFAMQLKSYMGSLLDIHFLWYFAGLKSAKEIYRRWQYDVVLASYPPPVAVMIAAKTARHLNIKYVVDFRDPWYGNPIISSKFLFATLERYLEKKYVKNANLIIGASQVISEMYDKRYQSIKNYHMTNGFDLKNGQTLPQAKTIRFNEQTEITIAYTGKIYSHQNIYLLLEIIGALNNKFSGVRFTLNIFGNNLASETSDQLSDRVNYLASIPREEIIRIQKESDLLVLLVSNSTLFQYQIPAKVFEYIFSGTPVLVVGENKDQACQIVLDTNTGYHIQNTKQALTLLSDIMKNGIDFVPNITELQKYIREQQISALKDEISGL
jgi:glycosyltransferase involved in cell wall biosynthesis